MVELSGDRGCQTSAGVMRRWSNNKPELYQRLVYVVVNTSWDNITTYHVA